MEASCRDVVRWWTKGDSEQVSERERGSVVPPLNIKRDGVVPLLRPLGSLVFWLPAACCLLRPSSRTTLVFPSVVDDDLSFAHSLCLLALLDLVSTRKILSA